jgi:hypothetical protein
MVNMRRITSDIRTYREISTSRFVNHARIRTRKSCFSCVELLAEMLSIWCQITPTVPVLSVMGGNKPLSFNNVGAGHFMARNRSNRASVCTQWWEDSGRNRIWLSIAIGVEPGYRQALASVPTAERLWQPRRLRPRVGRFIVLTPVAPWPGSAWDWP